LRWYSYDNSSKPIASWSFQNICNDYDKFFVDTTHSIAPDKTHALGSLYCLVDGKISFYLEKTDGSTVTLLTGLTIDTHAINAKGPFMGTEWSSDGKYALVPVANSANSDFDIYLLNVAQALTDPDTKPIKLITGNAGQYGIPQIQPQP